MPSMANIVVKKADGTTDITYTALTPSAGDRVAAQWRENTAAVAGHRPVVSARAQYNGPRDARKEVITAKYPYVDPVSGLVTATIPMSWEGTVPLSVPDTAIAEAIHQFTNLLASTLMRDSMKSGYMPT